MIKNFSRYLVEQHVFVGSINFHILNKESPSEILAEMPRRFFFRHLFVLLLSSSLLVALSSAQQPERSRNQKTSSVEDDLGLERRPFDDSLKHSSAPGETTDKNRINEDLLDYHDTYRDHSHDHEHLEEGEKVVHWEL